jgi:hypothetical protein
MLAQVFAQPPAPLPGPPVLQHYVLESPSLLVAVLVAGGLATLAVGRRSARARWVPLAGTALVLAGVVVLALAAVVRTDREAVEGATRELVRATAALDQPAMDALLADDVQLLTDLEVPGLARLSRLDKGGILSQSRRALGHDFPLESASVPECRAEITGRNVARSQVHVRANFAGWGVPHNSWWVLDWRRDPGRWRAITIRPVSMDGGGR